MKNHNLIIQPRMPGVVLAEELLASPEAFDRLFPQADVVDFTGLDQDEQAAAVKKYMAMYHCEDPYQKSEAERWRLRRWPERCRRDYYLAALANNDPALLHEILCSGDWNEGWYKVSLLIVSNPNISQPFLSLEMADDQEIRFDYALSTKLINGNFLVMPDEILSDLDPAIRENLVHGSGKTMFLTCHDDLHGLASNYKAEKYLRATTAHLFQAMPRNFRQTVVNEAADCLSALDKLGISQHEGQTKFWHDAFVYMVQYLFDFKDPLSLLSQR